jgi:ethanolamine utilization protein EutA
VEGIVSGLKKTIRKGMPITLVFDSDVGKLVGSMLYEEFEIDSDVISIDQLHLHDFEYIDIGRVIEKVEAVPIVIKSLVFGKHAEEDLKEKKDRFRKNHLH